jgi:hypothetical protein
MAIRDNNFDIISKRFPILSAKLTQGAQRGGALLNIDKPLAVMWAQTQVKTPRPDTLYIASGLGTHIEALLPRMASSAAVVVYESSLENLQLMLSSQDLTDILSDPRLLLMAGPTGPLDFEQLHQLPVTRIQEVIPLRFSPVWQRDERIYAGFFTEIARQFDIVRNLHLTGFNDALLWQASTYKNLPLHIAAPDVGVLRDAFRNVPVILVGAGPSLDEAEDFLREAADRAIIIGVNSSYKKLRKIGIAPHLVLAADPRDDTYRGFAGEPTDNTYLVAPFIVNPSVIRAFKGQAFSWSGENSPLVNTLRQKMRLPQGTSVLEKGTVSLSVADLAALMGCRRLILVGQDMAIGEGGLIHTVDSFYGGYKARNIKYKEDNAGQSNARKVPGNTLSEVTTLNNLYLYLRSFELWVAEHPEIEVINTSRLGAKIAGAAYMSYPDVLTKIPPLRANVLERLTDIFQAAPEHKIPLHEWIDALKPIYRYAVRLYELSLKAAIALEILPQSSHQHPENPKIKEIIELGTSINELIDKDPEAYQILLEGKLKKSLLDFQQTTRMLETSSPFSSSLTKNKEFFWALVEGIEPAIAFIKEVIEANQTTITENNL